jgi:hypothetical protein
MKQEKKNAMDAAKAELERKREEYMRDLPPGQSTIEEIEALRAAVKAEKDRAKNSRIPLLRAISAVQAEMPILRKTETANVGKYAYKYIPLEDIWATLQPILAKHGLAVTNTMDGGTLKAFLFHVESGESISCGFPVDTKLPPQALGSAYTYARRYALCALLQIVADKDDDGAAAMPQVGAVARGGVSLNF